MLFIDTFEKKIVFASKSVNAVAMLRDKERFALVLAKRGLILFASNGKNYKFDGRNRVTEL